MERIFYDSRRCVACHACELACAVEHTIFGGLGNALAGAAGRPTRRARRNVNCEYGGMKYV